MSDTVTMTREEIRLLRDAAEAARAVLSWGPYRPPVSEADALHRRDTLRGALAVLDSYYARGVP